MAVRSYQLTLAAGALRLSDVYGDGVGVVNAANDIPYRQILLSSRAAVSYVGGTSAVTSTTYGVRVEIGAAGDTAITLGSFDLGPLKLSDLWAAGAGATLHILGIPF